jgi:hypothetical protein
VGPRDGSTATYQGGGNSDILLDNWWNISVAVRISKPVEVTHLGEPTSGVHNTALKKEGLEKFGLPGQNINTMY